MRRAALGVVLLALGSPAAAPAQGPAPTQRPAEFWRAVGDTTLERLIAAALDSNRDLRAVEARVREARATRSESALELVPRITSSAGYSRQRLASAGFPGAGGSLPDQSIFDAGLQMSWELDVFGRLRRTVDARDALLDAAEEDVRDVQVLLAADVAGAYFTMRGAQDRLGVARRNADNQRRTLQLTQDRLELGRGNALETESAQAQLSSTLATIPALEAEIAASRHRIGVLLGLPPSSALQELNEDARAPRLPDTLGIADPAGVVLARPDVRSAERHVAASRALVGVAKADYRPRISIGAVAGYTANAIDAFGDSGTPRYAIGPVVSWPFLDLGRVRTRVDAARAGEAGAAARYEQTVLSALEEVQTSLVSYAHARERLRHLDEAAAASERATDLARLRFEEGATDFLEVLDAERRQLEAQDRRAAGHTEATNALVAVYRALGGQVGIPETR